MEIPVLENETAAGTLRVAAQGLYTLFTARLEGEGKGLSRLWLAGARGGAAPLGLLEPRAGERVLLRRLSRLELRALPPRPWKALALPAGSVPPELPPPGEDRACGCSWLRLPDGSLLDPDRGLLALPWAGGALPPGVAKIRVEGRDYWVFHT